MRTAGINQSINQVQEDLSALQYLYGKLWVLVRLHAFKVVLAGGVTAVVIATLDLTRPAEYTARALVRVGSTAVDDAVMQLRSQSTSVQAVLGRARGISAPPVILRAVKSEDLANLTYFQDPGPTLQDQLKAFAGIDTQSALTRARIAAYSSELRDLAMASGLSIEALRQINVAKRIEEGLIAAPAGTSNLVEVSFTAFDKDTAERITNAIVNAYFATETELEQRQLDEGVAQFTRQSDVLRVDLATLQSELLERRLTRASDGLRPERLRSSIARLTTEITAMDSAIRRDMASVNALASADTLSAFDIALTELGANSLRPLLDTAINEEGRLKAWNGDGVQNQSRAYQTLQVASQDFSRAKLLMIDDQRAILDELQAKLSANEAELSRIEGLMAEDAAFEADIRIMSDLLRQSEVRASALLSTSNLLDTKSTIVSVATAPFEPDARSKVMLLAKMLIAGGFVGGLVFLTALLRDHTYRFSFALEQDTDLPALFSLPRRFGNTSTSDRSISAFLKRLGIDKAAERPFCFILCSIGRPGERQLNRFSKTLERAATGRRCLVVECHTNKPPHGYSDVISGSEQTRHHLYFDPNATTTFEEKASAVARAASNSHDTVVFVLDQPTLLPPDCADLKFIDATVYVAEWGKTKRSHVRSLPEFSLMQGEGNTPQRAYALLLSVPKFICDFEQRFSRRALAQ